MKSEQNPVCVCGFWVFIDRQGWLIFWYLKSEIKAERKGERRGGGAVQHDEDSGMNTASFVHVAWLTF